MIYDGITWRLRYSIVEPHAILQKSFGEISSQTTGGNEKLHQDTQKMGRDSKYGIAGSWNPGFKIKSSQWEPDGVEWLIKLKGIP